MKEVNINNNEQINDMDKLIKEDVINIYTNSVSLAVGYYDFQFLFREQYPSFNEEGTDSANYVRLVMSPQHAKVFNMILENHIRDYERTFGKINISKEFLENLNLKVEE